MDFKTNNRTPLATRKRHKVDLGKVTAYNHCLQLYRVPPTDTISLDEFEELAVERLKVLKAVETAGVRHAKGTENYDKVLEKEIRETKLKNAIFEKSTMEESEKQINRWKDHVSHFILRLAYCRSEELRSWFIKQEVDLFRFRFQKEHAESRSEFLAVNNLHYSPIDDDEIDRHLGDLEAAENKSAIVIKTIQHYKVHFTEALDLVRGRRVLVRRGFAYVPQDDLISILLTVYRMQLSHGLAVTARALPHLEEDGRLLPMLCGLSRRYVGQDYSNKKPVGEITADMIDMLSKKSFPLCMQQLHQALKSNHHLRHGGRQQYGLFLKGIGLSLEEAMKFWRGEFMKIMDSDQFDKRHSYNIRHNYGKEGKKTDYTPYGCLKIITTNAPAVGDFHGCPFKHSDADLLRQKVAGLGIARDGVDQVMQYAKGGHYQVACARVFELLHGSLGGIEDMEVSIHHPNQYFEESYKRLYKDNADKPSSTPNTPRGVKIVPASRSTPSSASQSASQPTSQGTPSSSANPSRVSSELSGFEEMDDDFNSTLVSMDDSYFEDKKN
ncbi:hypothetical protein BaRGS_00007581 [Batillaria attramentaria]|uniref:DNA primase large subunit n=1 Tax=Batillaria attramentaria TaxID=370345 RepID=A0ABD0LPC5_9CAEN